MASSSPNWDEKYRLGQHLSTEPATAATASVRYWELCPNRDALELACGAGRNAVFLAERGWRVKAVDFSSEALARAQELAASRGVALETAQQDIEAPGFSAGSDRYGLAVVTQFLHRPLFDTIRDAVAPGGLICYSTYTVEQLEFEGGPRNRDYLLEPNELLERFRGWRVLRYEEEWEGRATAALIARKPTSQQ